jgi:hypothetical protein
MAVYRILRHPDGTDGGGATPTPAPAPTPDPTPPPPPAGRVELTTAEYEALLDARARLAASEAEKAREAERAEAARLKALADKGEADKALQQLRESKDAETRREREAKEALEREILDGRKESTIAAGLLGVPWDDADAAAQARQLLEPRFEAVRDAAGAVVVREKGTHRPAADVLKEWLASKPAERFLAAKSRGGAGARGGDATTPTGGSDKPPTLSDALIARAKEQLAAGPTGHYGLGRRG